MLQMRYVPKKRMYIYRFKTKKLTNKILREDICYRIKSSNSAKMLGIYSPTTELICPIYSIKKKRIHNVKTKKVLTSKIGQSS